MAATTFHGQALEEHVDQLMAEHSHLRDFLSQTAAAMGERCANPDLRDAVVQKSTAGFNLYDAYVWREVNRMLNRGELAWRQIPVGQCPLADHEIEGNDGALSSLSESWTATFWGGVADKDGCLEWKAPEEFRLMTAAGIVRILVAPKMLPLEVGTTAASRTLQHLKQYHGIARWPYRHDKIHVLVRLEFEFWAELAAKRFAVDTEDASSA